MLAWPPPYRIKTHLRAKSIKLHVKTAGLEITVPPRFDIKTIPDLLEEHSAWIIKHLSAVITPIEPVLPTTISLRACERNWQVRYIQTKIATTTLMENASQELVLMGATHHQLRCRKILTTWIKDCARLFLEKELYALSQMIGLSYQRLTIRDQKTVWGSCTSSKNINLNYKLIFLPNILMRYVLIHELCHLKHLNHSKKFWMLVQQYDPEWKMHRLFLRRVNQYIPAWLSGASVN